MNRHLPETGSINLKPSRRPILQFFVSLSLAGCSPAYQLSQRSPNQDNSVDIPRLANETPFGFISGPRETRDEILQAVLIRYFPPGQRDKIFGKINDLGLRCSDDVATRLETITVTRCINPDIEFDPTNPDPAIYKDFKYSKTCPKTGMPTQKSGIFTLTFTKSFSPMSPSIKDNKCVILPVASPAGGGAMAGGPPAGGAALGGAMAGGAAAGGATPGGAMAGGAAPGGAMAGGPPAGGAMGSYAIVPRSVAAVIHAAVDECMFWTYKEDTSGLSWSTMAQLLGLGALGGGIYYAVKGINTGIATVLTTTGAGVTLATNLQKAAPAAVQASVSNVIQAGLSYYPLIQAKALSHDLSDDEKIAALSGLWDAAGLGCSPGVLRGAGVFSGQ